MQFLVENLMFINTMLIFVSCYFLIGFIIHVVNTAYISLLEHISDSRKSAGRNRSKLSNVKEDYKNDVKLAYMWPALLIKKIKDVKAKKEE
tara:strand:+ start:781 stop:1053 length:273 start_codon:yes stop_codon:yes gene_type:complete